jgi:acetyl-CoA C-acetyltransferase
MLTINIFNKIFFVEGETMHRKDIVIVGACRTAVGAFGGTLANTPASMLGATVIKDLVAKCHLTSADIGEVIMGHILTAGMGQNPTRQAAIGAGLSIEVPAFTINQLCGSGRKAIQLAAQAIMCGDADVVIAGGQENMSMSPHVLLNSRNGQRLGNWELKDTLLQDGLFDAYNQYHMGNTAENIAEQFEVSREDQDIFAIASQQKYKVALSEDRFAKEIVPVTIKRGKKDPIIFAKDEHPKPDTTLEQLSKLRPAFKTDGTVTAGNASGINDGAAAVVVMSAEKAKALKLTPIARIVSYASAGVDPKIMGTGPIPATRKCLEKANWNIADLNLIEANEAFAAQAIYVNRTLGWDTSKVNISGGAIALGHPVGCSGARILVTLLHNMMRTKAHKGLATLCIGGGMGTALAVELL